jgi:hypothetical protein
MQGPATLYEPRRRLVAEVVEPQVSDPGSPTGSPPRGLDGVDPLPHRVAKDECRLRVRSTVRAGLHQLQHRRQRFRYWQHPLLAVFGLVGEQTNPPTLQIHVAPLQREQLPQPCRERERSDDEPLQVRRRGSDEALLFIIG